MIAVKPVDRHDGDRCIGEITCERFNEMVDIRESIFLYSIIVYYDFLLLVVQLSDQVDSLWVVFAAFVVFTILLVFFDAA